VSESSIRTVLVWMHPILILCVLLQVGHMAALSLLKRHRHIGCLINFPDVRGTANGCAVRL
jgi:hypothetical protein